LPYGAYLGTLLQTKLFGGRSHFTGPENKKALKVFGRFLMFVALGCILFLPFYFVVDIQDNLFVRLILQVLFPLTIATLIAFGFMDELFFKLKFYDPDQHNISFVTTQEGTSLIGMIKAD
jgi:hypothetical protein